MYTHYTDYPITNWRWENFSPRELASKGEGALLIHEPSLDLLQAFRSHMGVPFLLTSAYRSPAHNARVGGAPNSYHMKGMAFDVRMENFDPEHFEREATKIGFTGLIRYPNSGFIHIDTRPGRYNAGGYFPKGATNLPLEQADDSEPDDPPLGFWARLIPAVLRR
ncbi:hypothetical protein DDZ14_08590 [Maritimibacter sp. 55A14]|nr:hypothetical protein DDZ14_08590 [Maritimibacter sp. 55A14]